MLLQMLKICSFHPIVAVVGSEQKKQFCLDLGADFVIVKDRQKSGEILWKTADDISPDGYAAIFDANGLETLSASYNHLSRCGRLVTYGFHSNLPRQEQFLSPFEWLKMAIGLVQMPRFDPMGMVLDSRAVAGFNLSFFADEHELIERYMEQVRVLIFHC